MGKFRIRVNIAKGAVKNVPHVFLRDGAGVRAKDGSTLIKVKPHDVIQRGLSLKRQMYIFV